MTTRTVTYGTPAPRMEQGPFEWWYLKSAPLLDFTRPGRDSYKEHRDAAHFHFCGEIGWSFDRLALTLRLATSRCQNEAL